MSEISIGVLQLIMSLLAGAGLFVLWRRVAGKEGPVFWVVTAGALVRALAGQALFWISYLRLPFATSLQYGDGFWFFALDGVVFFNRASGIVRLGVEALFPLDPSIPGAFYIHFLAAFALLFGISPAVSLLLNLGAFLGSCALILKIGAEATARRRIVSIAALSLSPSGILWSLQPLKDVFFLFLVVLFIFACRQWQQLWTTPVNGRLPFGRAVAVTALIVTTSFALSNIRWFSGAFLIVAICPFLLATIAGASHRTVTTLATITLLPLLIVSLLLGGDREIQPLLRERLTATASQQKATQLPGFVAKVVERRRVGFEGTGGSSIIGAGKVMKRVVKTRPAAEAVGAAKDVAIPVSQWGRLIAGGVALALPWTVATGLGILDIRGGRGLWLFTDIDTIVFDAVLLYALWCIWRAIRDRQRFTAAFWLLAIWTALSTGALIYTISNYGTLFRHRQTIFLGLLLLPLTIRTAPTRRTVESGDLSGGVGLSRGPRSHRHDRGDGRPREMPNRRRPAVADSSCGREGVKPARLFTISARLPSAPRRSRSGSRPRIE